jgi:hypothetical protein
MTTEREMLEFAAKAFGITLDFTVRGDFPPYYINERGGHSSWNPLTNNSDCAAMCAKLKIATTWGITYDFVDCSVGLFASSNETRSWLRDHNNDRESAWRYAATMVAAKIGGMK